MDIQLKQKKGLKKKHIPYILGGVLLLFILWLILGDHSSTLLIDSRTITVGTARNDLFNDYIRVNGTVQPITILQLSPLEGGVVEKRNIEEGNTVKEGDVILTLSNQNLSASVLESESQLADRVNALRNAQIQMEQDRLNQQKEQFATDLDIQRKKRQYQQKEKLYNEKLIAREEYLQAKEDYELVERISLQHGASLSQHAFLRASHSRNAAYIRIPGYRPTCSCMFVLLIAIALCPQAVTRSAIAELLRQVIPR